MIIIFGRRAYGRVDAHGGEHAHTLFAHLYYVPLFPTSSFWVTGQVGGTPTGVRIPLHGRSVLAAYLRVWAPILAFAQLAVVPPVLAVPLALALLGLSVWAWRWRSLRGELAVRRSDYNRLAFGFRCEPAAMSPAIRADVGAPLRARWDKLDTKRSPNDVGQYGATGPGEAVTAYGLLALSAAEHGGVDERAAAERILRGVHEVPSAQDSPYREATFPAPADVHAQIASAAATVGAQRAHVVATSLPRARPELVRAKRFAIAAAIVGAVAAGGLIENARALFAPRHVAIADITSSGGAGEFVEISCAKPYSLGDDRVLSEVRNQLFLCSEGDHAILVMASPTAHDLDATLVGRIIPPRGTRQLWLTQLAGTPGLAQVYFVVDSPCGARIEALLASGLALLGLGLGLRGLTLWRRARK